MSCVFLDSVEKQQKLGGGEVLRKAFRNISTISSLRSQDCDLAAKFILDYRTEVDCPRREGTFPLERLYMQYCVPLGSMFTKQNMPRTESAGRKRNSMWLPGKLWRKAS